MTALINKHKSSDCDTQNHGLSFCRFILKVNYLTIEQTSVDGPINKNSNARNDGNAHANDTLAYQQRVQHMPAVAKDDFQAVYRSPLKWPGGKRKLIPYIYRIIAPFITSQSRLVEPFTGSASIALNLPFTRFWLSDCNATLIDIFKAMVASPQAFIAQSRQWFTPEYNTSDAYYRLRTQFNQSQCAQERALILFYMGRHGFNGLVRYNKQGEFNVPAGQYKRPPYFPEQEINVLAQRLASAHFACCDYTTAFAQVQPGDTIIADPPYLALTATANFTSYAGHTFDYAAHESLVALARQARDRQALTLIFNHDTPVSRALYHDADALYCVPVQRSISRNGQQRVKVMELIAVYHAR